MGYIVNGKIRNIIEEKWKYLIILDACRYDFFKKVYRNFFLNGRLSKGISPATTTMEWLIKVFPNFYSDIIYISSNPYINSKMEVRDIYGFQFDARKHFFKIIDVWKWGWNKELRTVPPCNVNKWVLRIKDRYKNKRFIIHYSQPHGPYIGEKYLKFIKKIERRETLKLVKISNSYKWSEIRKRIKEIIHRKLGIFTLWELYRIFRIPSIDQSILIYMDQGIKGIREAYEENLKLVLKEVKKLIDVLDGTILITADHGEYLGEYGFYGHGIFPHYPPVVEVPWFIIKRRKKERKILFSEYSQKETTPLTRKEDKEIIKERLRALGYI